MPGSPSICCKKQAADKSANREAIWPRRLIDVVGRNQTGCARHIVDQHRGIPGNMFPDVPCNSARIGIEATAGRCADAKPNGLSFIERVLGESGWDQETWEQCRHQQRTRTGPKHNGLPRILELLLSSLLSPRTANAFRCGAQLDQVSLFATTFFSLHPSSDRICISIKELNC